jgi:hypothetical protein
MTRLALLLAAALALLAPVARAAGDPACFAQSLPEDLRGDRLDDLKRLIGWVFDVAATGRIPMRGTIVDRRSTLETVPGFAAPTSLAALTGRYRVDRAFDAGDGYFGLELAALGRGDRVVALLLVNRLFRLPILLQDPGGVASDVATNAAMLGGWRNAALDDAVAAAETALGDAEAAGVPLLTAGQSQAGGEAQLQAAALAASHPYRRVPTGFVTLNAAHIDASIRRLGLDPAEIQGINFVKDLDPGFGPHGLLPNDVGLQVHIHPDGTGSAEPGGQSVVEALLHPAQHLLGEFDTVSLGAALAATLRAMPDGCADR